MGLTIGKYFRGDPKYKPQQWGPLSYVKSVLKDRFESTYGSPFNNIDLYLPTWERAGTLNNYASDSSVMYHTGDAPWTSDGGIYFSLTSYAWAETYQRYIPSDGVYTWYIDLTYLEAGTFYAVVFGNRYGGTSSPLQFVKLQKNIFSYYNGGTDVQLSLGSAFASSGDAANVCIVRDVNTLTLYINGIKKQSASVSMDMDPNPLIISNGITTSVVDNTSIILYNAFAGAFALSADQVMDLYNNPYRLIQPPTFRTYFIPSTGITIKNVSDVCSVADTISQISNMFSISDSGSGSDAFAELTAGVSVSDSGSGEDTTNSIAYITMPDAASAVDVINQISAICNVTDSGSGADSISEILASIVVTDAGSGADILTVLKELLKTVVDSCACSDSVSQISASASISDSASGSDVLAQLLAGIYVSDSGYGSEFLSLLSDILKTISESGTASDDVSIQPVSVSVNDAGLALDIIGQIAVTLSITDAATASEIISTIKTRLVTVSESGYVADSPTISVSVTVSDLSTAVSTLGQIVNAISVSDSGTGLDSITSTDLDILASGKVRITITLRTPGVSITTRSPGISITTRSPGVSITLQ